MSKDNDSAPAGAFHSIIFAAFIAVKLTGTVFASWSWWWLLFPEVPMIAFILTKLGVTL